MFASLITTKSRRRPMNIETKMNIETLKAVNKAISQSDNLEIMTNHMTQLLVAALNIKACAIFVLNPQTNELEIMANFGLSPDYLSKGPILADKSLASNLKGQSVIIPDIYDDKRIQYPEAAKSEGIAAIHSISIIFLNELMGVLRLYHSETWHISQEDLDGLSLLAENIGLAMNYIRLLNAVRSISNLISMALPKELKENINK
jgi:GAF domain-containing protein